MNTIELATQIRKLSLEMVHKINASHIGSSLSISDILSVLYGDILRANPIDPEWPERDRFILSKGHACAALYAALALNGFFKISDLDEYGQNGSLLMTHISHKVPGVEFSTGSLGHGLPFGCGKALAGKRMGRKWAVFVLLSDGELNEGSNWESILFAGHHRLDNLITIIDYNKIQSLGFVSDILDMNSLAEKFTAFHWSIQEIDGHDHMQIRKSLKKARNQDNKPSCIIAHTIKGKGIDFMENSIEWHYKSPNKEQLNSALKQLKSF